MRLSFTDFRSWTICSKLRFNRPNKFFKSFENDSSNLFKNPVQLNENKFSQNFRVVHEQFVRKTIWWLTNDLKFFLTVRERFVQKRIESFANESVGHELSTWRLFIFFEKWNYTSQISFARDLFNSSIQLFENELKSLNEIFKTFENDSLDSFKTKSAQFFENKFS